MSSLTETFTTSKNRLTLIFSPEDFHVRIFQLVETVAASLAKDQDYGKNISELFAKCVPGTSLLKILLSLQTEGLKLSYTTFPKQGIMLNGKIYKRTTSVIPSYAKGSFLLPSPCKQDQRSMMASLKAYRKYFAKKSYQDKLTYQCHLNGLTALETLHMYEYVLGFPKDWTKIESRQLAMQLT